MGSREQALIREFPNGETHLRSLLLRRGALRREAIRLRAEVGDLWTNRDQKKVLIL
jgi:hypothetical protein